MHSKGFASIYPFKKELKDVKSNEVAIVDVGGGHGQVLEDILAAFPSLSDKVVLEDLPETIAGHKELHGVKFVDYNFFEPQPVAGSS